MEGVDCIVTDIGVWDSFKTEFQAVEEKSLMLFDLSIAIFDEVEHLR